MRLPLFVLGAEPALSLSKGLTKTSPSFQSYKVVFGCFKFSYLQPILCLPYLSLT